jgi:glycosyltransferase involved in cell wall biosynthesis
MKSDTTCRVIDAFCPWAGDAGHEMSDRNTLCLNMIVKNERANLERCLASMAPYISCWVIGDTGSTDGTPEFIHAFFAKHNIPGELHHFPFVDFSQARNEALDLARASALRFDYLLLVDADMELLVDASDSLQSLTSAAYTVRQRAGITYRNIRLLRRNAGARYRGVTHEFLAVDSAEAGRLDGISLIDHATGSSRKEKYARDLRLLVEALPAERDPVMIARYMFYLANTLRDSGQNEAALRMYLRRAKFGQWRQEVFVSLLHAGRLKEILGYSDEEVISAFAEANAVCSERAEARHGAARFCRRRRRFEEGYAFAIQGLVIVPPDDALFPEDWIYEFGLRDELAVCAYWTGRYAECKDACDRLMSERKIPAEHHLRVLHNRHVAIVALAANYDLATRSTPQQESILTLS